MTHFDKLIELATEARKLHMEGRLELLSSTLDALKDYAHKADMKVMDERMNATYEVTE